MGVVVGTPDNIAPEQARGEAIDERVDIYALGGTLYFLVTGIPPFRTGKPAEDKYLKVVARHLRNPPPDAMAANPGCDRELAELARAMMAKKPAERPSYDELIAQLSRIVSRLDPTAVPMLIATRDRSRPNPLPIADERRPDEHAGAAPARSELSDPGAAPEPGASDLELPRAGLPGWLVALTFVCIALFVAGLVVFLRRDGGGSANGNPGPAPPRDAGATTAADSAITDPPSDMVLVRNSDGTPLFLVDARPITVAAFRQVFEKHEQGGSADGDPVVLVSYTEARSYAKTRGGRLLTSAEWESAAATPGFQVAGDLFEWVDTADEKNKVVRQRGRSVIRSDGAQNDITFRMAKQP
jgi:hypothetical protein